MKVLAFDIGIKNLAYCILENENVLALENVNLLEPVEPLFCSSCTLKASFRAGQNIYCKRHVPKTHAFLPQLSKKLPSNKVLKELVKEHKCDLLGWTNEKCIESLSKKFAFSIQQPKQANASHVSLETIHDALRTFCNQSWSVFSNTTHVLLENQPAFKNPHMKSVQVLLFATLREQFLKYGQTPSYHFVHAKKKVKDAPAGDAGYAERKNKSEDRVKQLFDSESIRNADLYLKWKSATKKSDMADAICMAVDFSA